MEKRRFLKIVVNGGGALVAGIVGIPAALSVLSPVIKRDRGPNWQIVGTLEDFPIGEITKAVVSINHKEWPRTLAEKAVFVWREEEDQIVVYSRNCTDLSCPVTWDPRSGWFFCPCHGGMFSKDGEPQAGPPKRPLYRYATRIRNATLEIDLNSLPPMT